VDVKVAGPVIDQAHEVGVPVLRSVKCTTTGAQPDTGVPLNAATGTAAFEINGVHTPVQIIKNASNNLFMRLQLFYIIIICFFRRSIAFVRGARLFIKLFTTVCNVYYFIASV